MKPIIRKFKNTDITAVTAIQSQAVLEGLGSFSLTPLDEHQMLEKLVGLQSDHYPCLVAELDNHVLGFAYASPHRPRPGYRWTAEDSVYVSPYAHGKGIGFALLNELVKQSEALGFRQMVAIIGDSDNAGSIGVHKKCGFEMAGKLKSVGYKNGKWLDVILMRKPLGKADTDHPTPTTYPGNLFND